MRLHGLPGRRAAGPRPRAPRESAALSPSARADRPPSRSEPPGRARNRLGSTSSTLERPRLGWPAQHQPLLLPPPSSLPRGSGRDSAPTLDLQGTPLNTQTQQREARSRSHGHRPQQWQSWRVGTGPWQGAPEMLGGKQRQPRPPTGLTAREGASRGLPAATCAAPPHLRTHRTAAADRAPGPPRALQDSRPFAWDGRRGARAWTLGRFLPFSLS